MKGAAWEGEVHKGNDWGTVFTRGGYLVHSWEIHIINFRQLR